MTAEILGVDHIGLEGLDISKNQFFKTFDYNVLFSETNLENFKEKQEFISTKIPKHEATFLRNQKGVSIEMVDYKTNNLNKGKYDVLIEWSSKFAQKNIIEETDEISNRLDFIQKGNIPNSNIPFYFKEGLEHGITTVVLRVSDMEKSLSLWEKTLDFQVKTGGDAKFNLLSLKSLISTWNLELILIEDKKMNKIDSWLDSVGWNCLSLITKNIESELDLLKKYSGISCGKPYMFKIAGKKFKILFIKGYDRELIELIEPVENHD